MNFNHVQIISLDTFLELADELTKEAASKKVEKKPIDRGLLKETQKREHELWHTWNNNGRKPEHLKPLMDSLKPVFKSEANKWRGVEIPKSTINAEINKHALNALKKYNPDRGVQLSTWMTNNLKKTGRFIKQYQNLGRIPEAQIGRIRKFKQAQSDLFNQHGFEPDTKTLADHLGWPHKRVVQLQKELSRQDKPVSGWLSDPADVMTPKELEAIHILQYDNRMSTEERTVYEYTFGINGKSKLSPGEIAKKANLHPSKVSRIRNRIKGYVQEAMSVL